jgi:L-aspartate oxidase
MNSKRYFSDFLVIGSGIAGLTFAIKASTLGTVHVVTKKKNFDSNTNYAQGGIASVIAGDDTYESHIVDTLKAGAGLCNEQAVRILVESGPDRVRELIDWGTRFSTTRDDHGATVLDLGREGGHSHNRIVHSTDLTGREIENALLAQIEGIPNITVFENHTVIDLLTEHQLQLHSTPALSVGDTVTCYGAYILENDSGAVHIFNSGITFVASGGVGQVYQHTTNPDIATGDGIAMAYRAGALIADMEFIQFHPTSLYDENGSGRSILISEAVRGEGAVLLNAKGERLMESLHPLKELAPRDIVARAIDWELKKTGAKCVYLDITFKGADFLLRRFPYIYSKCLKAGIDISREPIPVVPAAHYLCGGIVADLNGRTSIRNLFVSGEASCTGVHGATRLASNSLLEGIVFSHRAFIFMKENFDPKKTGKIPEFPVWNKEGTFDIEEWILIQHNIEDVQRLMWDYVGIVRSNLRLQRAYRRIMLLDEEIKDYYKRSSVTPRMLELRNMATVAKLIIKGATTRRESRGLHYNTDYPDPVEEMRKNVDLRVEHDPELRVLEGIAFE